MSNEEIKEKLKLSKFYLETMIDDKAEKETLEHCGNVVLKDCINAIEEGLNLIENSISKDKIREIFEKINQCEIRTDGKVNAKNYMICGETERAYGWFINLDYIEKILLDRKGYNIGE